MDEMTQQICVVEEAKCFGKAMEEQAQLLEQVAFFNNGSEEIKSPVKTNSRTHVRAVTPQQAPKRTRPITPSDQEWEEF